jgi:hypothetical protein
MSEDGKESFPPKETSQGLPVVSETTVRAIESQFTSSGDGCRWGEYLEKVKERLIKENPHLVEFIEKQVGKYPKELHTPMFEVIVGTVALMEHQARANKTTKLFGGEQPKSGK